MGQEGWEHGPKKQLPGDVQPDHAGAEARGRSPAGPQEVAAAWVPEGPAASQAGTAQSSPPPSPHSFGSLPAPRLPAGGKAVNTAPVPGQTPHDESDRRTEPRSSVSDLVNSLTSEMLMVRRAGGRGWGAWGSVMQENDPGGQVSLPCLLFQLFHPSSLSVLQFPHLSRQTKNSHPPPISGWSQGLRKSDTWS